MNPLAKELNEVLKKENSCIYDMLSARGKNLFFPKGILSQSAEAKVKAKKFNATIGIATENGRALYLPSIHKYLSDIDPDDVYPYAPSAGTPELRKKWKQKLIADNPSLQNKSISLPIVTSAITHGLSLAGELFVDEGDVLILPDKLWGNYRLIFGVRLGAEIKTFPFYNNEGNFNTEGLINTIRKGGRQKGKLLIILNFPSNPTGYSLSKKEAMDICEALHKAALQGLNLVVISDDAYFGLFYDDKVMKESLFSHTANLHKRILAIKLDGVTKEYYAWGLRVGFITYGAGGEKSAEPVYASLEKKTMGAIRGGISNSSHISQSLILKAMKAPGFADEIRQKRAILEERALKVAEVLQNKKYHDAWTYYPFNSGYFMCLRLKSVNAELLRQHLLDKYGIGVISAGETDIRVAFSCIELQDIRELFDLIYRGVKDLS